jgi:hypothetical protein
MPSQWLCVVENEAVRCIGKSSRHLLQSLKLRFFPWLMTRAVEHHTPQDVNAIYGGATTTV